MSTERTFVTYFWGKYVKRSLFALTGALAFALTASVTSAHAASITPDQVSTGFSGTAYGSYIFNTDKTLTSGPTASASVACTNATGKTSTNTANLLGGLITAGAITSESIAEKSTAGTYSGTNTTNISNLKVLGAAVNANPGPNTVIDLKAPVVGSVGKVTLNGQVKRLVNGTYQVWTTAIRVEILKAGLPGLNVGTDIRLGVTTANLTAPQAGYLSGTGFGTRATLATGIIGSSPTALAYVGCSGGTTTVNAAGVTIPAVASTGAISTTATGALTPELKSTVTNNVAGLKILNSLIQADAIKAETSASRPTAGGAVKLTDTSSFTNLKITGLPNINASVPPNTVVQVPGLGAVTLHKVSKSSTAIIVVMVDVVLNQPLGALPTGSRIQVGYSSTSITS